MATEIASAYISLIPSFQGGQAAIASQMGAPAVAAGKEAGGRFGGAFSGAFSGIISAGAMLGGMALVSSALQQSITQADLPGAMRSQFALTETQAAEAAQAAGDVYAKGFGDSLTTVGTTAGTVTKALNDLGDASDLTEMTTQAQALADKFGEDVKPMVQGAAQMVKTGLAANMDEAFDLMTVGFQSGANASNDLLDTITEYSTKFRDLGLSGSEALGLVNQGLSAGARNSDLVADALKEFSIRAIDGSKLTAEGFAAVGLNAQDMAAKIAGGGDGAKQALDQTLESLRAIEDPVARDAAAVALFGTQAEDLGDALYSLDPSQAADKLGDVGDAADKLAQKKGAAQSIRELGRSFKSGLADAITPLIPVLSKVVDFLTPLLPVLVPLAVAIGVVTAAQWAWNAALLANPIGLIVAAVIAAAVLIITYWDEIVAGLTAAWNWLVNLASTVWQAITDGVVAAWGFIVGLIVGYYTMIWTGAVTIFNAIIEFFAWCWDMIKTGAQLAWQTFVNIITGYWNMAVAIVQFGVDAVLAYINFLGSLPGKAKQWFGGLVTAAVGRFNALVKWAKGLPGRVLSALGNVSGKLRSAGYNLIQGLLTGMRNAWGAVKNWIMNSLSGLKDSVLSFFGIQSPSKLFAYIGEMMWAGLPVGAKRQEANVAASTANMTALAVPQPDVLAGAASDTEPELTGTAMIDLGDGIQKVFDIKWGKKNRQLKRSAGAGAGAL